MRSILFLVISVLCLVWWGCKADKDLVNANERHYKKATFSDYPEFWGSLKKYEKKGLGKQVVELCDSMLLRAAKENNVPQTFKILATRSKYIHEIEENGDLNSLQDFRKETEQAATPTKQLLASALGELYLQYAIQNQWKVQQRTEIEDSSLERMSDWGENRFILAAHRALELSLTEASVTYQYPVDSLAPILSYPGKNDSSSVLELRPTVYDFLAYRAINLYRQHDILFNEIPSTSILTADYFELSPQSYELGVKHQRILGVYDRLINLHKDKENTRAYYHSALNRLEYLQAIDWNESSAVIYGNQLRKLLKEAPAAEIRDDIRSKLANHYYELNQHYTDSSQNYLDSAYRICGDIEVNTSYGSSQCAYLQEQVSNQQLQFTAQAYYLPASPIFFKLNYTNIPKVYIKVVKGPHRWEEPRRITPEQRIKNLLQLPLIREFSYHLPENRKYQQSEIELYSEGLEVGHYYLLISSDGNFDPGNEIIAYTNFNVSGLAFLKQNLDYQSMRYIITDRETGLPMAGVSMELQTYSPDDRDNGWNKYGNYISDKNGFIKLTGPTHHHLRFKLYKNKDTLFSSQHDYIYPTYAEEAEKSRLYLFTDRAIYRPGQTVYFKGIQVKSKQNNFRTESGQTVKLQLYNASGSVLSEQSFTTNSYGSLHGSFQLPATAMGGSFRLASSEGSIHFQVEQYKRPTFTITFDSSKEVYSAGDSVTVSGKVKLFSGVYPAGIPLRYKVYSMPRMIWRHSFPPYGEPQLLYSDTTYTVENGQFEITFESLPASDKDWGQNYKIEAEAVLDHGESQQKTHYLTIGKQAVNIQTNLSENTSFRELKKLKISAFNQQGSRIEVNGLLNLYALKEPKETYKNRYWKFNGETISPKGLTKKPNLTDPEPLHDFEKGDLILSMAFDSRKEETYINQLNEGSYLLEIVPSENSEVTFNHEQRFILFKAGQTTSPTKQLFWYTTAKKKYLYEDTAFFYVGSGWENVQFRYLLEQNGNILKEESFVLNDSKREIAIALNKSYAGGLILHLSAVRENRFLTVTEHIDIPFYHKQLNLNLTSSRNLTEPGANEKWILSVEDYHGKAAVAEVLLSAYDQSLDEFVKRDWNFNLFHANRFKINWEYGEAVTSDVHYSWKETSYSRPLQRMFPELNWFGFQLGGGMYFMEKSIATFSAPMGSNEMWVMADVENEVIEKESQRQDKTEETAQEKPNAVINQSVRSDFRETIFFYPTRTTNDSGKVQFEFNMPDALTSWKLRALAHTRELSTGSTAYTFVSQKKLMLEANLPRFFRKGDEISIQTSLRNISEDQESGRIWMEFTDAHTQKPIDLIRSETSHNFELQSKDAGTFSWDLHLPESEKLSLVKFRISAKGSNHTDVIEGYLPVLPATLLLTESFPFTVFKQSRNTVINPKLKQTDYEDLSSLTFEYTDNPIWTVVQSLPAIIDPARQSSESIFDAFFARSLIASILENNPQIQEAIRLWEKEPAFNQSPLRQNEELKSAAIKNTPWLSDALTDEKNRQALIGLLNENDNRYQQRQLLEQLLEMQLPNGAWPWFNGMQPNQYLSAYIVAGLGKLQKMNIPLPDQERVKQAMQACAAYLDEVVKQDYQQLISRKVEMDKNHLTAFHIYYFYARSLSGEIPSNPATDYYKSQIRNYWTDQNIYLKSLIGMAASKWGGEVELPQLIQASLLDYLIGGENRSYYWKELSHNPNWYTNRIEAHAMALLFLKEMKAEPEKIRGLEYWLISQKQTQMWHSAKATSLACYSLLQNNASYTAGREAPVIEIGNQLVSPLSGFQGYVKNTFSPEEISPEMQQLTITKTANDLSYGAIYWQRNASISEIREYTIAELKVQRKVFKQVLSGREAELQNPDNTTLQVGDKLRVRLVIESKRDLEFVHLKDLRASGLEPVQVISAYQFQDGLGYYQETTDVSTNFYFDRLYKGRYILEYELKASQAGNFENGISTLQCLYAPEFVAHSASEKLQIKK